MTTTNTNVRRTLAAVLLSTTLILSACGGGAASVTPTEAPAPTVAATEAPAPTVAATEAPAPTVAVTEAPAASGTRQVTADNGTIEVPAVPQRVATIGNTTLPFIDMGGKPIAVTAESDSDVSRLPEDQQATYASATILAASADEVDMEELASQKPDLILVQVPGGEFDLIEKQLAAIAPTVFFGLDTEWKDLADRIAEAANTTDALSEQKAEFEQRLADIKQKYGAIIDTTSFVDVIRWSSSDPGTFAIADIGCSEIARDDVGLNLPEAAEGEDPLAWTSLSFEQLGELSKYDVIMYPVDAEGQPTEPFVPVIETNTWQALPEVSSGQALGVFCPGNNSYGAVLRYLESLDRALATLPNAATETSSATEAPAASGTTQVETDNGTVSVPANPQRVVVLVNAVLAYLDLGGTPVGVTEVNDATLADLPAEQQAAYRAATNVASSSGEIDLEKVASLQPDVIIIQTGDSQFAEIGEELNSIAPTVFLGQASDWEFRVVAFATAGNLLDTMNEQKAKYDELLVTLKQDYADVLQTAKIAETYRSASSDAGQFTLNQSLCAEVARDDGVLDFEEPVPMSFEQIGELTEYDLILYPATSEGQPTAGIQPLVETNAWKLLPAVEAGHAQGVYCPWGRSYGFMSQYLEGFEQALATLPKAE